LKPNPPHLFSPHTQINEAYFSPPPPQTDTLTNLNMSGNVIIMSGNESNISGNDTSIRYSFMCALLTPLLPQQDRTSGVQRVEVHITGPMVVVPE